MNMSLDSRDLESAEERNATESPRMGQFSHDIIDPSEKYASRPGLIFTTKPEESSMNKAPFRDSCVS